MSEYLQKNKDDVIQRKKDRRNMLWRMEDEEKEKSVIQKKSSLEIGASDDIYEQEADAVAAKVVGGYNASNSVSNVTPKIQLKQEEGPLMAKSEDGGLHGTDQLESSLNSSKGSGESLKGSVKSEMESKMGTDLSGVKVHSNSSAHSMAEGINAKAFTHGQDIYFNEGNYNTSTTEGKGLLAHELTHTQQQKSGLQRKIQRAMKFEFQTHNVFWKINNKNDNPVNPETYVYRPNASLAPRKFGSSPFRMGEFGTAKSKREDGVNDYIATGSVGRQNTEFMPEKEFGDWEEVKQDPLAMVEIKKDEVETKLMPAIPTDYNPGLPAQFVREYVVRDFDALLDLHISPTENEVYMVSEMDRAFMNPLALYNYNMGLYEFIYYREEDWKKKHPDIGPPEMDPIIPTIDAHQDVNGIFHTGTKPFWIAEKTGFDLNKQPEFIVIFSIEKEIKAGVENDYKEGHLTKSHVVERKIIDNKTLMPQAALNLGTYDYQFYEKADLQPDFTPLSGKTPADFHLDRNAIFSEGRVSLQTKVYGGPNKMANVETSLDFDKAAQFIRTFKVNEDPKKGKKPKQGDVEQVGAEINNGKVTDMYGKYNPETFDFQYYLASDFEGGVPKKDAKPMEWHLDPHGKWEKGRVTLLKIGRGYDVDLDKPAQYIITYTVTTGMELGKYVPDSELKEELRYDYSTITGPEYYNPDTYEFRYFNAGETDFTDDTKLLDVHRDRTERFQRGHVKLMKKHTGGIDQSKEPQYFQKFYIKDMVIGQSLPYENIFPDEGFDNAENPFLTKDQYIPETYEYAYFDYNTREFLPVHRDKFGIFRNEHVKFMKYGVDQLNKEAQFVVTVRLTDLVVGERLPEENVQRIQIADNATLMEPGDYEKGTYEFKYYDKSQFTTTTSSKGANFNKYTLKKDAKQEMVHKDSYGVFRDGHVKRMVPGKEGNVIEMQSETDGAVEFETSSWMQEWSELKAVIEDAVNMTNMMNDATEITDPAIKKSISSQVPYLYSKERRQHDKMGTLKELPFILNPGLQLRSRKEDGNGKVIDAGERIIVEIPDKKWFAGIQTSQEVHLSEYESLLREHEAGKDEKWNYLDPTLTYAKQAFDSGLALMINDTEFTSLTEGSPELANLRGFIQLIMNYLLRTHFTQGAATKFAFQMMSRTSFYSMYHDILSPTEQKMFKTMVDNGTFYKPAQAGINFIAIPKHWPTVVVSYSTKVYTSGHGGGSGPSIGAWLKSIIEGVEDSYADLGEDYRKDRKTDLLSPVKDGSASLGAKDVETEPGKKDTGLVKFELRDSEAYLGGRGQPASNWVKYAETMFYNATRKRSTDPTADDPTTKKTETTDTDLIYNKE